MLTLVETDTQIKLLSHAKINLALEVFGKRKDNFHEIVTLMQEVDLSDTILIKKSKEKVFSCNIKQLEKENSILKAVDFMEKYCSRKLPVSVYLEKKIPIGVGLGGESSNAGSTILAINKLFNLKLNEKDLLKIAEKIGSDTPFFIKGVSAICYGRGEKIMPVKIPEKFYYVLVVPPFLLSTKQVYQNLNSFLTKRPEDYIKYLVSKLSMVEDIVFNRLEEPAMKLAPYIANIKEKLRSLCIKTVSMTGSGPGIFGICRQKKEAEAKTKLAKRLRIGKIYLLKSMN